MDWVWKLIPYETWMEETYGWDWQRLANSDIAPNTLWRLSCVEPKSGRENLPPLFVDMADLAHLSDVIKETAEGVLK